MPDPIVTQTFSLSAEDLAKSPGASIERRMVLYALLGMGIALYGVFSEDVVFQGIGALLLGVVVVFRVMLRRHFAGAKNAPHRQDRRYTITEEALRCETADGSESSTTWPSIVEVDTSRGMYRLSVAKEPVHLIPADAFASDRDRARFEALLVQKGLLKENERRV